MKKLSLWLIAVFIGFVSPVLGEEGCCVEFAGEWLYMLSAIDQPYYAINVNTGAQAFNGDRVANDQEWHSGYRLEFAYRFGCEEHFRVRWTQFNNFSDSDSETNRSAAILNTPVEAFNSAATSSISDKFDFYYLDFLYERDLYCCCPFYLGLNAGIQYARLTMDEDVLYFEAVDLFQVWESQSKMFGVGPELGLNLAYSLFSCFDLRGRASGSLLISKKEAKVTGKSPGSVNGLILHTENEEYWLVTPTLGARLGLGFDRRWSCGNFCGGFHLDAGYEIIHFMKGVDRIYFTAATNVASSITQQMDFTLHGPYVRAGLSF